MSKVGSYMVTKTLGEGTFGKVKLATHKDTNVEYAIKILDKKDIKENELTVSVRREIAIMKALNHRNIVNLREVLSSKNKLYIVMDLVKGGELFTMIERRGELDERTARKYFQQLVDGIDYCHKRGVFHRDLKPENLLLDENGVLKITDFGVSSVKKKEDDLLFTACGTPYYCAPEILANTQKGYSGEKVDSWSCGVILYLLLVGELPFRHDDSTQLYEQIKACRVNYPSSLSPGARDLLSRILVRDPDRRYTLVDVKTHPWFKIDYDDSDGTESGEYNGNSTRTPSRNRQEFDAVQRKSADNFPAIGRPPVDGLNGGSRQGSQNDYREYVGSGPLNNGLSRGSVHSMDEEHLEQPMSAQAWPFNRAPGSVGVRGQGNMSNNFSAAAAAAATEAGMGGGGNKASFNSGSGAAAAASPPPPIQVTDLVSKYEGKEMIDFIRDALPGKTKEKWEKVLQKLGDIDIDCVEDVQTVAETTATPENFRKWLEDKDFPDVTSMRLAKMFFPHQVQ